MRAERDGIKVGNRLLVIEAWYESAELTLRRFFLQQSTTIISKSRLHTRTNWEKVPTYNIEYVLWVIIAETFEPCDYVCGKPARFRTALHLSAWALGVGYG